MSRTYAALWVKSNYSFLEGASHPEELVERAHALGLSALAITDRDGVYGLARAHVRAKELGLKLLAGAEISVRDGERISRVVLFAKTRAGYASLCQLISKGRGRCSKGISENSPAEIETAANGLLALCADPILLERFIDVYGESLFALCCRHRLADDVEHEKSLRSKAILLSIPIVAGNEVLYHDPTRRSLQDVLACIRAGCTLSDAGTRIQSNAEHDLKSPSQMAALFIDDPDSLNRTVDIADRCSFDLSQIRYRYPAESIPSGHTEQDWLRVLTMRGAHKRYGAIVPGDVQTQIERELVLIGELDYGGYFLTMHEIVEFCRQQNILCQGRGSAANSAVCYCLGITAVDPVRMELLFERFLSRERAEPPDIDLDIEHERREEVIQHVYDKYGRKHAAMVANVIRYRGRSAVRDVGKALGLPATDIDGVARMLGHYDSTLDANALGAAGVDVQAPAVRHFLRLVAEIQDFPRHLSIHPGGFLLGHEPIDTLVPIEPATMEGRTVIQWDKYDVEALGLFKVDLLGLGALSCVHRCFDLMRAHDGVDLDMARVRAEDDATYDMISKGDTVGVFQIESRAQMAMLPRLRPASFYDLVIEVAIVRPGPIQGDMVHPYLKRRSGQEAVTYPHRSLERVLGRTLGVPIFQEQVMKLAMVAAGYTPGEADQLRRDMAAWRSAGRIEGHHDRLVSRMVARGIPLEFAERVFSQIRGFGEYGFPESHAASFALIAYVTAWLRCHHPAAFVCAILNSQPMGFYSPSTLVEDAKRHGVTILPIDVNQSSWDCTLERDSACPQKHAVRMGLRYVKGLGTREREQLEYLAKPFSSLDGFAATSRLSRRALVSLAEAGAFECFGLGRRDAIWRVRALATTYDDSLRTGLGDSHARFPSLSSFDQIGWDYRTSLHSARGHPMMRYRKLLERLGVPDAEAVHNMRDRSHTRYVGMVICRQRPGTATGVTFFTLEDETGFVNLVVWRDVFERFAIIARTVSPLGVDGKLQVADGVTHLIADRLWIPNLEIDDALPTSRDFH